VYNYCGWFKLLYRLFPTAIPGVFPSVGDFILSFVRFGSYVGGGHYHTVHATGNKSESSMIYIKSD
jgi:hypothetical protein